MAASWPCHKVYVKILTRQQQAALSGLSKLPVSCGLQLGRQWPSRLKHIFYIQLVACQVSSLALPLSVCVLLAALKVASRWTDTIWLTHLKVFGLMLSTLSNLGHPWYVSVSFSFSMKYYPSREVKKQKHLVIFLLIGENIPLQLWGDVLNSLVFSPGKAVIAANVWHT